MNTPLTGKLVCCENCLEISHMQMNPYICLVQAGRWPGGRGTVTSPQTARMTSDGSCVCPA